MTSLNPLSVPQIVPTGMERKTGMRTTQKDRYGLTMNRVPGTPDPFATWQGAHGPGAMREHRARKRLEAETRNVLTPSERKRDRARGAGYRRHSDRLRAEQVSG